MEKEFKKLFELKKQCGFWGRGYVHYAKFQKGLDKLNKELEEKDK